jgi:hypothetical protein
VFKSSGSSSTGKAPASQPIGLLPPKINVFTKTSSSTPSPQPVAAASPPMASGLSNVADTFSLIGFRTWDAANFLTGGLIPGKEKYGYVDQKDNSAYSTSDIATSILTNPAFVFGAPAAVAAVPFLLGGSTAAGATAAATGTGSTIFAGANTLRNVALAGGAGFIAGSIFDKGAPVAQTQRAVVTPSQVTTTNNYQSSLFNTNNNQQTNSYNIIYGSGSINSNTSPTASPSGYLNPSQTSSQDPTQTAESGQEQSASSGINPLYLLLGAVAGLYFLGDR